MFIAHILAWWIRDKDRWLYLETFEILDPIGATAFLLVAGISTMISYRNRMAKNENSETHIKRRIRNEYMLRAFFIFVLAIVYNLMAAIKDNDLKTIWTWYVLLTVAISLFLGWPLLKTPKYFRVLIGVATWIAHILVFEALKSFKGDANYYGLLYHVLYNEWALDPILPTFPFFLFGTVLGDMLFDINLIEDQNKRKATLKVQFLIPLLILGLILIAISISYDFISIPKNRSYIWLLYSLGIILTLLSVFMVFEEYIFYKVQKSYKFLFYYSYYSLTIYLAHNALFFLFSRQISWPLIWIYIAATFIIVGLVFRFIFKKWGYKASLKMQLGRLASGIAGKIEERNLRND
jgi:hypothetical protein